MHDLNLQPLLQTLLWQKESIIRSLAQHLPYGLVLVFDAQFKVLLAEGEALPEIDSQLVLTDLSLQDSTPAGIVGQVVPMCPRALLENFQTELHFDQKTYRLVGQPLFDPTGQIWAGMLLAFDISELKNAQLQLREVNHNLENRVLERTLRLAEINAELETFTYSVSHDLRSPLRSIQGFAQILLEDYAQSLDSTAQDYANRIVVAAGRMDRLITDLLEYSRLSQSQLELGTVNLDLVVVNVLQLLENELSNRNVGIFVEGNLGLVKAHPQVLERILFNLIGNSIKYASSERKPEIRLEVQNLNQKTIRLWVKDNGIGIASEHFERIFRPFERLHGIQEYPGTGIGLAFAARGINRLGGDIGVESELNQGSQFWIELERAS